MSLCAYTDVQLLVHTSHTQSQLETLIAWNQDEIEKHLGSITLTDKTQKKLCAYMSARDAASRPPRSNTLGEVQQDFRNQIEDFEREINKLWKILTDSSDLIVSSSYQFIDEDERYTNEPE